MRKNRRQNPQENKSGGSKIEIREKSVLPKTDPKGHTVSKPLSIEQHHLRKCKIPEAKSSIIKNKYAVRYLAGQEKMCRLSGMAQRITPELLQLRQRDQDMHRILKVALQPWPTLAGMKALIEFGIHHSLRDSYFRADYFCKYYHDDVEFRQKTRKWPLIVPKKQAIHSTPSWRWTSSSMRERHRGQLLI